MFFIKKHYVGFDDEYRENAVCSSENVEDVVKEMAGQGHIYEYEEYAREIINQGESLTLEISLNNPKPLA